MIYFNDMRLDNYFTLCEVQYDRVFLYQKAINEDYKNSEMESGKTLKIILYKKKYREDLDNYLKYKMGILNMVFTTNAFWLKTDKNDCFYGYFSDIKEEIKGDYTAFITLTFTSLYPFSFTYLKIENKTVKYDYVKCANQCVNFGNNALIYMTFTNPECSILQVNGGACIYLNSGTNNAYLTSTDKVIINRTGARFVVPFYYKTIATNGKGFGTLNVINADCFVVQDTLLSEGLNK